MATLQYINGAINLEMTYTDNQDLMLTDHELVEFVESLIILARDVGLVHFYCTHVGPEPSDFTYGFEASDGRAWLQHIKVVDSDASMNFAVDDFWKLSEFALHRTVRDHAIQLIGKFGVTDIEATW